MTAPRPVDAAVVIATHNRRALVAEAIESVRRQTTKARQIIVVDDHSDDGTLAWLRTLPDVTAISSRVAHNRSGSRNSGLELVDADAVLFLDDDDLLEPTALEQLSGALTRHPEAAAAIGGVRKVGGWSTTRAPNPRWAATGTFWREILAFWTPNAAGQTLYRRNELQRCGGFDQDCDLVEDLDLILRFAHRNVVTVTPAIVFTYRFHGTNVSVESGATRARLDAELRQRFIAAVGPDDGRRGELALLGGRHLYVAMEQRIQGRHGAAFRSVAAAARTCPWMLRSTICAPVIARLGALSLLHVPTRSA